MTMTLRFLGKDTQDGQSPTLWESDGDWLVIQGFTDLDSEVLAQVGAIPPGEAVIRVPKKLMRHLRDASGAADI
jgi:hypothetical protein